MPSKVKKTVKKIIPVKKKILKTLKIGVIIGRSADTAKRSYLKDVPKDLRGENDDPPADVAVAWYIKKTYPFVKVDIITPNEISLARLNQNNFVYVMYDLIDAYNEGGFALFEERTKIYSNTKAVLYPTVSIQKLIISKSRYYNLLQTNSIPVAPFISLSRTEYMKGTATTKKTKVKSLLQKIEEKEWPGMIAKPELGSYGTGIKIFHNLKDVTNKKLFDFLAKAFGKEHFEGVVFQRYMEDFPHYFEIRTYWINGQYVKSVGTIIDYNTLGTGNEELYIDTPKNEGGDIPSFIIDPLLKIGQTIIKILPKVYGETALLVRLDFGCCQVNDDIVKGIQPDMCKKYFLNEIELTPNLFPDYGKYDIIKGLGDALVEKAKELAG